MWGKESNRWKWKSRVLAHILVNAARKREQEGVEWECKVWHSVAAPNQTVQQVSSLPAYCMFPFPTELNGNHSRCWLLLDFKQINERLFELLARRRGILCRICMHTSTGGPRSAGHEQGPWIRHRAAAIGRYEGATHTEQEHCRLITIRNDAPEYLDCSNKAPGVTPRDTPTDERPRSFAESFSCNN